MNKDRLTIGQAAKAAGVRIQTLHYYERQQILFPASRTDSGYRMYGTNEVKRLQFIKHAQELGFALSEIKELLALRVKSKSSCGKVLKKTQEKISEVDERIKSLKNIRKALLSLTKACENRQETNACPILSSVGKEKKNGSTNV